MNGQELVCLFLFPVGLMYSLVKLYTGKPGYETDFQAKMEKELVADLIGKYLFTDADFVRNLSVQNRNLFQRLLDEIKYLLRITKPGSKEAKQLEKIKKLFEEVYRDAKNTAPSDGVKYSIVALENGNVYVKASRNVITGQTKAEQRKNITDFFKILLDSNRSLDIHTAEGDILTITKSETANKARDDYKTVAGKHVQLTNDEFAVKLRIAAHIDKIAETSSETSTAKDKKNHAFAKDGFSYRRAYFEDFDGQYYEITLSIGHNGSVATIYDVSKIKKGNLPSAKIIAVVGSKALGKSPSMYSLSENRENVNPKMSLSEDTVAEQADGKNTYSQDVAVEQTETETSEDV